MSATIRVADVIRSCWDAYNSANRLPPHVGNALRHILECRTAALGGHWYECDRCRSEVPLYNSCQDRNCPTCQTSAKEKWLAKRREEVLPVQYFHTVFTLPHTLNGLVDANRRLLLGELFSTANWVLQSFAHDPQWRLEGQLGFFAVLHTWTQKLQLHFHLHCVIPGGVWRRASREWVHCRDEWLFGKEQLSAAFRNRYINRLRALRRRSKLRYVGAAAELASDAAWSDLLSRIADQKWIVFPKAAPAGTDRALEYIGRYTHKVGISDYRISSLKHGVVTFSWRDRDDNNQIKYAKLPAMEFTKRFAYHILPKGFHKIRYYGWLSAANRTTNLEAIRKALDVPEPEEAEQQSLPEQILQRTGIDITACPNCHGGRLKATRRIVYPNRGPPICTRKPTA